MKILVFALSGLGDALMFSPALKALRAAHPDAQIDLLAMFKGVEELYSRNPDVSSVHCQDFLKANPLSSLSCVLRLRREHYDVSINVYPSNRWHYNVLSFLVGAKRRLGHDYGRVNFRSLNFLNTDRIAEDDRLHNVEENLRLVGMIGGGNPSQPAPLQVILTREDTSRADQWLKENIPEPRPILIGFHAGSSPLKNHIRRRWAPEKFAALGARLIERQGAAVLLFGGPEERDLNDSLNRMMGGRARIVSVPSLMVSAGVMKKCALFVVNDSGLMHVAAGLQIPVVTIFAYTNPNYVHPWKTPYTLIRRDLDCSPCFYYSPRPARCIWKEDQFRCITHIEVEEVLAAAENMLRNQPDVRR